jgi:hypothetical protein
MYNIIEEEEIMIDVIIGMIGMKEEIMTDMITATIVMIEMTDIVAMMIEMNENDTDLVLIHQDVKNFS